jgi:hypothetical protein
MFEPEEVTYDALLEVLGGREWLELMINARDFEPIYHIGRQGLSFTFRAAEGDGLRMARFVPMGYSTMAASSYAQSYKYELRMTIETLNGLSFELAKPYHCVDFESLDNITRTFEVVTHLTLTF